MCHARREVLAFNVACPNLHRDAAYYVAAYSYYVGGAVTARSVFYGEVDDAVAKDASFRLIVSGQIGVKEIERLIKKLELDKEILADQDDEPDYTE